MAHLWRRAAIASATVAVLAVTAACKEGPGGIRVAALSFTGNQAFDDDELQGVIVTEGPARFASLLPWVEDRYFNREAFDEDLERLRRFYADRGYPHAAIQAVHVSFNDTRDEVTIEIGIQEGAPLVVEEVRFEGLDGVDPDLAARVRDVPLEPGAPLDRQVLARSMDAMSFQLRDRGYPKATVDHREADGTSPDATVVTLIAAPGPYSVFGDVDVVGARHVAPSVVTRTLTFKPGSVYRQSEVLESQRELASLGIFDFAHVAPNGEAEGAVPSGTEAGALPADAVAAGTQGASPETSPVVVPMVATVSEGDATRMRIGVGYGSEDGPRGALDWQHSNIFGGAQRLTAEAKYSLRLREIGLELTQPYVFGPNLSLHGRLGASQAREPNYRARRLGGEGAFEYRSRVGRGLESWPIERVLRVTYRNEALRYSIAEDTLDDLSQLDELVALGFDPVTGSGSGRVGSFSLDAQRNVVDQPLDPQRGYRLIAHLEHAAPWLGGTFDYEEVRAEADGYLGVGQRAVLAGRVRTGLLLADTASDVPFSQRYFLGGSTSLRGWGRFQVAPLTGDGLPIGGRAMLEINSEIRWPIAGSLGLVGFVDAGNVWTDRAVMRLDDLQVDAGPGLRWTSPVGVLRADLGIQITRVDGLIVDGKPERSRWRFHLSIGQAF